MNYKDEFLKDLKSLIAINSSLTGDKIYPNKNIKQSVILFLEMAKKFGMETHMHPDGVYGYAEIGSGEEMIGIVGHLDVVPEGEKDKWETPAFELTITDDGFARGRGVQDDKGPTLLCLYAMRIIKESGINLKRRIRIIVGTDEESQWRGIGSYVKEQELPSIGFSPDSSWPVIFAEKLILKLIISEKEKSTLDIEGGSARNVVPSKAVAKIDYANEVAKVLTEMKQIHSIENNVVTVNGKPYHAKDSHKGDNAIMKLAKALEGKTDSKLIKFINEGWNLNTFAPNIFGKEYKDEELGLLTTNIGTIKKDKDGKLMVEMDIRVPHPKVDGDMISKKFDEAAKKYDINVEWLTPANPIYYPKDSQFIQSVLDVYEKHTGSRIDAIASGGGTYAKTMPNSVAIGAMFPTSVFTMHQENERVLVSELIKSGEMYTEKC